MRNEELREILEDDDELLEMLGDGEIILEFEITKVKQQPAVHYPPELIVH